MYTVHALQSASVFKGLTSLVYAVLLITFLKKLDDPTAQSLECKNVAPTLRMFLYVLAWIGAVSTGLYTCGVLSKFILNPTFELCFVGLACAAIAVVYVVQIQYIDALSKSYEKVGKCHEVSPERRQIVQWFSMVLILFGLMMMAVGVWGEPYFAEVVRRLSMAQQRRRVY